jgi:general secretion pathway protein E
MNKNSHHNDDVLRSLPYAYAKLNRLICAHHEDAVSLLITKSTPISALNETRRQLLGVPLKLIEDADFDSLLQQVYGQGENSAAQVVGQVENDLDLSRLMQEIPEIEDLLEAEGDAPIIRMINALLTEASREGASDIHIEPFETYSAVRFRVDGSLRDIVRPKRALHSAIISRLKIMAQLDIAEKRLPQDGRITLRIGGKALDVRVSTLPTGHGERAVLRLLEKDAGRLDLAKLGMCPDVLTRMDRLIHQPHGIVLVTGPTGSGKTTTLYAALQRLDALTTNIMTVEDPIEYDLSGVGQIQVNSRIELTFARALRAILRQDPDVIMIGEIRDLETAQIAVQASLTGHLVLATLHTNDASSAVTRLLDMGIEPFLLASSLLGVLAQRLVRRLCTHCKTLDTVTNTWRAVGCTACNHTGYAGRTGIHELFVVDDELRRLMHDRAPETQLRDYALMNGGMISMRDDGTRWVASGTTALEEIIRVTRD